MCEYITCETSVLQYLFYNHLTRVKTILQSLWLKHYKVSLKAQIFIISEISTKNMKLE